MTFSGYSFRFYKLWSVIFLVLMAGCIRHDKVKMSEEKVATEGEAVAVQTAPVTSGVFHIEMRCNGRLAPLKRALPGFERPGRLTHLNISNGQYVSRGDTLAVLDNRQALLEVEQARIAVAEARTQLLDLLLTQQATSLADTVRLSPEKKENLFMKSGLKSARNTLRIRQLNYSNGFITAPFSGRVANVEVENYQFVSPGDNCCLLLDDSRWRVIFYLMESELEGIGPGTNVEVLPFDQSGAPVEASITNINPVVDDNGLVEATARLKGRNSWLMDGRNVQVRVLKNLPDQLIVPKQAMVLRSNRPVVFVFKDGLAKWIYVDVVAENDTQLAVKGELRAGEEVIVTNNMNLSHDAEVGKIIHKKQEQPKK
jgi:RND family efflux transporter MFP subunit